MPRTKGSKNKVVLSVDERIAAVNAEIESLQEQVKEKKAELKQLKAEKEEEASCCSSSEWQKHR